MNLFKYLNFRITSEVETVFNQCSKSHTFKQTYYANLSELVYISKHLKSSHTSRCHLRFSFTAWFCLQNIEMIYTSQKSITLLEDYHSSHTTAVMPWINMRGELEMYTLRGGRLKLAKIYNFSFQKFAQWITQPCRLAARHLLYTILIESYRFRSYLITQKGLPSFAEPLSPIWRPMTWITMYYDGLIMPQCWPLHLIWLSLSSCLEHWNQVLYNLSYFPFCFA